MDADDLKAIETQRLALLGQLTAAETALRIGLNTHGFGSIARAHMERALAHVQEAAIAINEINRARTVEQLINDLIRVQQMMDRTTRDRFHHV